MARVFNVSNVPLDLVTPAAEKFRFPAMTFTDILTPQNMTDLGRVDLFNTLVLAGTLVVTSDNPGLNILEAVGWNLTAAPITVTWNPRTAQWDVDYHFNTLWPVGYAANTYYVDGARADNTGDGLSWANAKRDISAAVTLANATNLPAQIYVQAGVYPRVKSPTGNGGTILPTVATRFTAVGGKVYTGPFDDLAWPTQKDATFPNCTRTARSNVARVFDILNLNEVGGYTELTPMPSGATASDPLGPVDGAWAQVGSDVVVRRRDGLVATNENTRVFLRNAGQPMRIAATMQNKPLVMEGFALEGGAPNAPFGTASGTNQLIAILRDCSFGYGGSRAPTANMVVDGTATQAGGFFIFDRCVYFDASKDAVNAHNSASAFALSQTLTIRCITHAVGQDPASTSNNAHTLHGTCKALDFYSTLNNGRGGTVRNIDDSKSAYIGTFIGKDLGDGAIQVNVRGDSNAYIALVNTNLKPQQFLALALQAASAGTRLDTQNVALNGGSVSGAAQIRAVDGQITFREYL